MGPGLYNQTRDRLLSTGNAARLLSVTPDTVLKWIKSGRLPAVRTAGGHYRVARRDIDGLMGENAGTTPATRGGFVYCWEYYASGEETSPGCAGCLVYRARARRCYEMSGLAREAGFAGAFCRTNCEECAYYQEVVQRHRRVLIVTERASLRERLLEDSAESGLELRFAGSEYDCSALCADFRPEYVVVDAALPKRERASLCSHLAADPRVPGVQIILAVRDEGAEQEGTPAGEGALPRTFSLAELEKHIIGLEVTPKMTA